GEQRDAEPDAFDEDVEREPTGTRHQQDRGIQANQDAERRGDARRDDRDEEHRDFCARIDALQPAWLASKVFSEHSVLDRRSNAGDAVLEPADVARGVVASTQVEAAPRGVARSPSASLRMISVPIPHKITPRMSMPISPAIS